MQSRPFWVPMNKLRMFQNDIYYNREDKSDYVYNVALAYRCSTNIKKMWR